MSAEEADKTTTTDASAGDEEEEWLYGGKKDICCPQTHLPLTERDTSQCTRCSVDELLSNNSACYMRGLVSLEAKLAAPVNCFSRPFAAARLKNK